MALLGLALLELSESLSHTVLVVLGASLVANRLLHAAGMLFGTTPKMRAVAMMATHGHFLIGGVALLYGVLSNP